MKQLKIVQQQGSKRLTTRQMADADIVIDSNGVVIKDRYGLAHREATPHELRNAVKMK